MLQKEFGRNLSDEGVHVLDPFVGAGVFLARLLQSDLIQASDLERKYREELHANEIVLLAYYIAAVNIEEAYRGKHGEDNDYEPFNGIVLTDTFNLNKQTDEEVPSLFQLDLLPANNARVERQQDLPIQVIVGNPPWSSQQRSGTEDNPNVDYPQLEQRIRETYAEFSTVTNLSRLYDTYKLAIRWASDRIKEQGMIAFVTNGSWIDGNVDAGIRACLAEEFTSIYVLNLRGNQRTQGEQSRREGGKVFGQGSRAPVAITILVKNLTAVYDGCRILYRDIGDYLSREEKLAVLAQAGSISEITDWQEITPNEHYDWIGQRSEVFAQFYPLRLKDAQGEVRDAIFGLSSQGLQTNRDAYIYNFSREACTENARKMTEDYLGAISELEENSELAPEEAARRHAANIRWAGTLKEKLKQKKKTQFKVDYLRKVLYRPFVATNCYANYTFVHSKYHLDQIFLKKSSKNRVICVPGVGIKKPFSVIMTDTMPDFNLNEAGPVYFPRYSYPKLADTVGGMEARTELLGIEQEPNRIDNISTTALHAFCAHYRDNTITKDMIFDYIYGVLHAQSYREQKRRSPSMSMCA